MESPVRSKMPDPHLLLYREVSHDLLTHLDFVESGPSWHFCRRRRCIGFRYSWPAVIARWQYFVDNISIFSPPHLARFDCQMRTLGGIFQQNSFALAPLSCARDGRCAHRCLQYLAGFNGISQPLGVIAHPDLALSALIQHLPRSYPRQNQRFKPDAGHRTSPIPSATARVWPVSYPHRSSSWPAP